MKSTPTKLGARLRAARNNVGLTQDVAASRVGMQRTALVQIEAGKRTVSSLELNKLALLYGRDMAELIADDVIEDNPLVLFRSIVDDPLELTEEVQNCIEMLREATKLHQSLGAQNRSLPPIYRYPDPGSYKEAVEQGKEMAVAERRRLDLGSASIQDVADVIVAQSMWAVAVPLRDEVSGLFLRHSQCGLAILVNENHPRARRRFSYAHEYAHALADRDRKPTPTTRQNSQDLIEKRANAFASEFLMPEAGVRESLERMRKGGVSRDYSLLYDPATDKVAQHESRVDPTSQRITAREVAILANEYKVSYDVAVYRLSDIGVIRKPQVDELISQKADGRILIEQLKLYNGDEQEEKKKEKELPYLSRQLALLAIEAFRRDKITRDGFRNICKLAGLDANQLLRVAEALT